MKIKSFLGLLGLTNAALVGPPKETVAKAAGVAFEVNKDASFSIVGQNGFRFDSGTYMLHRYY